VYDTHNTTRVSIPSNWSRIGLWVAGVMGWPEPLRWENAVHGHEPIF
jgi:hypothetical protein